VIQPPFVALAAAILLAYALSLWWFLRRESPQSLMWLLLLCSVSLTLRLAAANDYPAGLHDDEPKILASVMQQTRAGNLLSEDSTGLPVLLNGLFQAQLVPLLGPGRWAIRLYSLVTSVLATAAAFAAARAMGCRVASSLAAGALVAVLPWSIFWGRISMGGELPFHQLLLLAALARLVWDRGGLPEMGIGGLALGLLLYDYWAGRVMLGMPLCAALLAQGRRRLLCLGVLLLAIVAWLPYVSGETPHGLGAGADLVDADLVARPFEVGPRKLVNSMRALVEPVASNGALTIATAAMHPPLVLVLALAGSVCGLRRAIFLWGGFLGGLLPELLSIGAVPSAHRMMMAFPFLALAAGNALEWIGPERIQRVVAAALVMVVGVQSVSLYFSEAFWPTEARWRFDWELTRLVEALPEAPHPRFIVAPDVGDFFAPRALVDPNHERLALANRFPSSRVPPIYVFGKHYAPLRPLYERLVGPERVESFGRAFLVHFDARDWSWLQAHGWAYEVECDGKAVRGQVPVLFFLGAMEDLFCIGGVNHRYRGRWLGPAAQLQLRFSGRVLVEGRGRRLAEGSGPEQAVEFPVTPGEDLTVTFETPGSGTWLALFEVRPGAARVPTWEYVAPPVTPLGRRQSRNAVSRATAGE
jgi:hypothetical protein